MKWASMNCAQLVVLSTQLAIHLFKFFLQFLLFPQHPHQMHLKDKY